MRLCLVGLAVTLALSCGRDRPRGDDDDNDADSDTDADTDTDGPADPSLPYCATPCTEAIDCCGEAPPAGCPDSGAHQWECRSYECWYIGCRGDGDCDPGDRCFTHEITNFNSVLYPSTTTGVCARPCDSSEECAAVDPDHDCLRSIDGRGFCGDQGWDDPCSMTGICAMGVCDRVSGDCYCQDDEICQDEGYDSYCRTP